MGGLRKCFLLPLFFYLLIPLPTVGAVMVPPSLWIPLGTDPSGDAFLPKLADSEQCGGAGEIWFRDYTYTHASDNKREYLRETAVDDGYQLIWIYGFVSLPPRNDTKFYIKGRTTRDDPTENMSVQWSISLEGPWFYLGNVTSAPEEVYGPWDIPDDAATAIYIRIKDAVEQGDKKSGILIDHMYIACALNGADKIGLYFHNDGVYAYFNETLVGPADKASFTYVVYIDKPEHGQHFEDFRLVYSLGCSQLQQWDKDAGWVFVENITVMESPSSYSLCFKVSLTSIANPDIRQDTGVWFAEYHGMTDYTIVMDRAPDEGKYHICSEVIPELPWPVPLVFVPAVVATVYLLYFKRFRKV